MQKKKSRRYWQKEKGLLDHKFDKAFKIQDHKEMEKISRQITALIKKHNL